MCVFFGGVGVFGLFCGGLGWFWVFWGGLGCFGVIRWTASLTTDTATMQIDKEIWRLLDKFDSLAEIYGAVQQQISLSQSRLSSYFMFHRTTV